MKEAYYFPHDANARTDARILELRAELGWEGYGLWWALVEQLREASDYKLSNVLTGGLAMGLSVPKDTLRKLLDLCIGVGLLNVDGEYFYSPSLCRRMSSLDAKRLARSESARNAAEKRWQSDGNANAMRTHSDPNTDAMPNDATVKESKGEKSKVEKKTVVKASPTLVPLSERFSNEVASLADEEAADWAKFCKWESENPLPSVYSMAQPLLPAQLLKLTEDFGWDSLKTILFEMENYLKLHTKKSAYLTANNWLTKANKQS